MYKLNWFQSVEDIPKGLWADFFPAPYEGKWWFASLELAELESQFKFFYGLITYDDKPVAIAPAFLMDVPIGLVIPPALLPIFNFLGKIFPSILYQRTFFIGSPCSDEGRIGHIENANLKEIFAKINSEMTAKAEELGASMRVWKDFTLEQRSGLKHMADNDDMFHLVSFPGTHLDLIGTNKNDYYESLKQSRRHNLKKKIKKGSAAPVFVEVIQNPNKKVMDEVFTLFWQTYEKGDTKFEQLNQKFFDEISRYENAHYVVMRHKESKKMVAFMLCFKLGNHVINKFIGIDYSQPKEWFLYFSLWDAVVEWCYVVGAHSIQSGQTGYQAKILMGNSLVELSNYCRHKNPFVNFIYRMVAKTISWETLDSDLAQFIKAHPELKPRDHKSME